MGTAVCRAECLPSNHAHAGPQWVAVRLCGQPASIPHGIKMGSRQFCPMGCSVFFCVQTLSKPKLYVRIFALSALKREFCGQPTIGCLQKTHIGPIQDIRCGVCMLGNTRQGNVTTVEKQCQNYEAEIRQLIQNISKFWYQRIFKFLKHTNMLCRGFVWRAGWLVGFQ